MKNRKKLIMTWVVLTLCLFLSACALTESESESVGETYEIYYSNKDATNLVGEQSTFLETDTTELVRQMLEKIYTQPKNVEIIPVIQEEMLLDFALVEKQVTINMSTAYKELDTALEVLARAAIVSTLTQLQGVDFVSITVQGEPLLDVLGNPVGVMSKELFIKNAGEEINSYDKVKMTLYFANEQGDGLIEINRTLAYQNIVSMEKLVVEQIIAGPSNGESYPTMNPETNVISATIKDGVCYVNLDETFLTQPYNVSAEVTIYSIVNSLVELSNVNKVQISIEGKNNLSYREQIDLMTLFERNLDLLK